MALRSAHLTILFSADIRETEIKLSSIFFCRFALKQLLQDIIILGVRLKLKINLGQVRILLEFIAELTQLLVSKFLTLITDKFR